MGACHKVHIQVRKDENQPIQVFTDDEQYPYAAEQLLRVSLVLTVLNEKLNSISNEASC